MSASISPSNPQDSLAETPANGAAKRTAEALKIGGVTGFSATDYPGLVSSVVFVQGCPWRCRYCHNTHLQRREQQERAPQWPAVFELLKRRVGLVDAVVFSGGEPTVDPALEDAIDATRALGFKIGLHSGGAYPERLKNVLPHLDWIGFDVKANFDAYARITGMRGTGRQARESMEAILASGIEHEFRTTIHPALLSEEDIYELARTLSGIGVKNYALQVFRAHGCVDDFLKAERMRGFPSADLVQRVSDLFPTFTLRDSRSGS